jgi:hypothetical protein
MMALLLVAAIASAANAYDFLYTGDTPKTHDARAFGLSGRVVYLMSDSLYDEDGEKREFTDALDSAGFDVTDASGTYMWIPIDIYYSITDQFEVGIQPKFGVLDYDETSRAIGGDDRAPATPPFEGTGLGDTWAWAKYAVLPEPMVAVRLGVKIDTGIEPAPGYEQVEVEDLYAMWLDADEDIATGDGQMDVDGAVMFGTEAGQGVFEGALGYRYRMEQEVLFRPAGAQDEKTYRLKPGNEIHFAASFTYYLTDALDLTVGADGFFGSDPEIDGAPIEVEAADGTKTTIRGSNGVWINPNVSYMIENGVELGIGLHYPLMGQNMEALWGIEVYVAWGM